MLAKLTTISIHCQWDTVKLSYIFGHTASHWIMRCGHVNEMKEEMEKSYHCFNSMCALKIFRNKIDEILIFSNFSLFFTKIFELIICEKWSSKNNFFIWMDKKINKKWSNKILLLMSIRWFERRLFFWKSVITKSKSILTSSDLKKFCWEIIRFLFFTGD